jgi:hypothetical protein
MNSILVIEKETNRLIVVIQLTTQYYLMKFDIEKIIDEYKRQYDMRDWWFICTGIFVQVIYDFLEKIYEDRRS